MSSKRDYERVALLIRTERRAAGDDEAAVASLHRLAVAFADVFTNDSESFDRARFMEACDV